MQIFSALFSFFMKVLAWFVKFAACTVLGALALLWNYQGLILYLPTVHADDKRKRQCCFNDERLKTPSNWDARIRYEDVWIRCADDVYIHAWLLLQQDASKRDTTSTMLYFHGNAGNIGFRLANASQMYHHCGCNILMVEYRGYGSSEGSPTEPGIKLDAIASLEYLQNRPDINEKLIFVFGRSLGGAAALSLATRQDEVAGFIIENTFSNIHDMVCVLAERLGVPVIANLGSLLTNFLTSPWENDKRVASLSKPILFVSGTKDELIPPEQMQSLYQGCASVKKEIHHVPGGDHNSTWQRGGEQYLEKIDEFMAVASVMAMGADNAQAS